MPLVCVCSPKGGVGKTTVVANLAYSLSRQGSKVLVVDFDSQNALRLHFGVPLADPRGYVAQSAHIPDWGPSILKAAPNIFVLPYGDVNEEQRLLFEENLAKQPLFIHRGLGAILKSPDIIVIADLPPGRNAALKAIQAVTDLNIIVMLADTASLSLLPNTEHNKFIEATVKENTGEIPSEYYVINQIDMRKSLNRDVTRFFEKRLANKLLGTIHRDECVAEANAAQRSIIETSSVSAAAFDIEVISKKVTSLLGVSVGDGSHNPIPIHDFY